VHGACHTSRITAPLSLVQLRSELRVHTESNSEETNVRDRKEEIVREVKQENGSIVHENIYKHTEYFFTFGMTSLEIF
jgi:hypothetical protein